MIMINDNNCYICLVIKKKESKQRARISNKNNKFKVHKKKRKKYGAKERVNKRISKSK